MPTPRETLCFAGFELDLGRRELRRGGQLVALPPTPLRVLLHLAEHRDRTVPRQELLDAVWPGVVVGEESVTRALAEVRRVVGDDGEAQRVIRTHKGLGVRFVAALEPEPASEANGSGSIRARSAVRQRLVAGLALGVLLAAGVAAALYVARDAARAPIRSLAVLPLENLSGDPKQKYFADGMTDVLTTELAKLPGLRVASRTSVLQYEGAKTPLREIAAALGVDAIVEGSVLRDGERVRITAQLIEGRSDRHVWAERYERELARALEIQSEVARAIAGQIELALTPEQAARLVAQQHHDPRAVDAVFRAIALFHSGRSGQGSLEAGIAALQEAIRYDPDFAPAYAQLSMIHTGIAAHFPPARARAISVARESAARALELDPNDGQAHAALGWIALISDWDWKGADRELRRSVELGLSASHADIIRAQVLLATGRRAEALRLGEAAMNAAPLATEVRVLWAYLLLMAGEAARAAEQAERALEVSPDDPLALQTLHDSYSSLDRGEDAAALGKRIAAAFPARAPAMAEFDRLHRESGRTGSREFWQQDTETRGYLFWAAVNRTTSGERDAAIALLERAYQERDPDLRWLVAFPALDPLHGDPRFQDLARRMNLPLPTDRGSQPHD